ncbi:hypothetical protein ASG52_08640 [Methylobacterium sp. Leaf456]|uniref:hypothetical protein n=1 Tax=Methylobacterium sp. Leaf456 TaxID=1736382 RepID=UPI0006F6C951|nr:hypothetical protein [Methylobacterium sp. Leaf456]KQT50116.1 hypothetical protein ASG52_08640 [Methylobacterium sp. Leaf456]
MSEISLEPRSADESIGRAQEADRAGKVEEARRLYAQGARTYPDLKDRYGHPVFLKESLRMLLRRRLWDEAEALAAEIAAVGSASWSERLFARAYATAGDRPMAARHWARIVAVKPDDREALDWTVGVLRKLVVKRSRARLSPDILFPIFAEWNKASFPVFWKIYLEVFEKLEDLPSDPIKGILVRVLFDRALAENDHDKIAFLIDTQIQPLLSAFDHVDYALRRFLYRHEDLYRHLLTRSMAATEDAGVLARLTRAAITSINPELAREGALRVRRSVAASRAQERFDAALLSADACLCANKPDEALQHYRQAGEIAPGSIIPTLGCAAVLLDRGELGACADLLDRVATEMPRPDRFMLPQLIDHARHRIARPAAADAASLDVIVFSHATEKMKRNRHLAPPSPRMIAGILGEASARATGTDRYRATIMYDHRDTPLSWEYLGNLDEAAAQAQATIVVNQRFGLRRQWIDGLAKTDGAFVAIIEQDHHLLGNCPDWATLIALFGRRPDVSYIRLNRRRNVRRVLDCSLYQTPRDVRDGLTRTTLHSNTPHVMRRSFYEDIVRPIIESDMFFDGQNGGAAGVEETINRVIRQINRHLGEPITSRLLGMTLWGDLDGPPTTQTLGF